MKVKLDKIRITWQYDEISYPDYLQTEPEQHYGGDKHDEPKGWDHVPDEDKQKIIAEHGSIWNACVAYAKQDQKRLDDYSKDNWFYVGCVVECDAIIEYKNLEFRHPFMHSLWGIESDCGADYTESVEKDCVNELLADIENAGIAITEDEYKALKEQVVRRSNYE